MNALHRMCLFLYHENSIDSQGFSGWFVEKFEELMKSLLWTSVSNFCLPEAIINLYIYTQEAV